MLVQVGGNTYPILSSTPNGSGWDVVISNPEPTNRVINNGLVNGHSSGDAVSFFLRSQISAAAHTFEYAGSGTNYLALPQNGGSPVEANQIIQTGAAAIAGGQTEGRVWYTSTDEVGKFKAGDTFQIDQQTGYVSIDTSAVATNLVSDLTPQLGGNLDVLTRSITTSITNGDIDLDANGSGLIKVTEYNLSQVPIVTQHDIGTAANEVPLNGYLGGMAFQDPTNVTVDRLLISAGFTVATLPTGIVGLVARVTDASAPAVGSTVVGGGAAAALCWYNGTAWTVIGV
jgi:hypothetical protein